MERIHIKHQKAARIIRRVNTILSNGGLPKTGQYSYYPYDDGYYQMGYPLGGGQRFMDNGDGTAIDLVTGLMWVKDPSQLPGGMFASPMYWYDAINACESLEYAGWDDWRLPNINELLSIINHSMYIPCLDTYYFTQNPPDGNFWSSTRCASWYDGAWIVSFYDGSKYVYGVPWDMCYVRPVRAGQA
ncbi:MAG: DUF1566 domain-containing protein [Candidatus Omnitrophota bacterium]|jgi:hypothetical protein